MSFWPLAKKLLESIHENVSSGAFIELGCGNGDFASCLKQEKIEAILLDINPVPAHLSAYNSVQADIRDLPFQKSSIQFFILANTLRNIPGDQWARIFKQMTFFMNPQAKLIILEDSPNANGHAQSNYRKTVSLLSILDPLRGEVLSPDSFSQFLGDTEFQIEAEGSLQNQWQLQNPMRPIMWMEANAGADFPMAELESLQQSVGKHGMACGEYWWAVCSRKAP